MLNTTHLDDPLKPVESSIPPLSALEISGAISARVIHDLSNLLSGIIGNAEYAQNGEPNPETLKKVLHAISLSANSAGKLIGQCLPLQKLVSGEAFPCETADIASYISDASTLAPGWRAEIPLRLVGQVRVQPRWLAAVVWQIARETEATRGEVSFHCGRAIFPIVWRGANPNPERPIDLFQITLHFRAEQMLFGAEGPVNPERFGLLAAHELVRRFRGQIHARPKPPGRQEVSILIPLL